MNDKNYIWADNILDYKELNVNTTTLTSLSNNAPSISEFYAHQNVFITGGTGFMGKVLIEKLLRSCPQINGIYILLRSKRNYTDEERLDQMFNTPLFEVLKAEQPEFLSKVKIIKGDVSQIKCGLSESDMEFIINEINIVFHVAASVRFDDPLKKAILINTRGTREIVQILKRMKNLKVFLHTSTTYCNIDKDIDILEEKVYKATTDWKTMISAAENMDVNVLNFLEKKIINKYPNTYTFGKNLAEEIVSENCGDIPTVIFRPTVVISTVKDPISGWIDNFNGPMGLVTSISCGIVRTVYGDGLKTVDWIPVDIAINGMIVSAWYKALEQTERNQCLVINTSTTDFVKVFNTVLNEVGLNINKKNPFRQTLWYPFCLCTSQKYIYWFYYVILHLIPAIFLNVLLKLTNQRLDLFKIYRRIFYTNMRLAPFLHNEWSFKNDNFKSLNVILKPEDKETFSVDYTRKSVEEFLEIANVGIGLYLLKEKDFTKATLQKRLFNLKVKYWIHVVLMAVVFVGFLFLSNLCFRNFAFRRNIKINS